MIVEIFLALLLGIVAGTITGLFPGIHINLVALMLFAVSGILLQFTSPIVLGVFIVAMAISHSFLDFIPSIFLGAPEESTALSILPGHRLLLKGRGYEAVRLTAIGSFIGIILTIILTPLFIFIIPPIYGYSSSFVPLILIAASGFLIWKEEGIDKKLIALFVFIVSGILGVFTLDFSMIKEPLFPLLTGLFGMSILFVSLKEKKRIPKQNLDCEPLNKKDFATAIKSSIVSAPLCSFLPGLGASQAAVLGSSFSKIEERGFLLLLGIIGTLVTGLNFVSLYIIQKGRSGASVIIGKLLELNIYSLWLLIAAMLVSGSIALILSLCFSKAFSEKISGINYGALNLGVILLLVALSIIISGPYSLIILVTSTALGIFANETGIKKMHLMGCLMLPVIFYLIL